MIQSKNENIFAVLQQKQVPSPRVAPKSKPQTVVGAHAVCTAALCNIEHKGKRTPGYSSISAMARSARITGFNSDAQRCLFSPVYNFIENLLR